MTRRTNLGMILKVVFSLLTFSSSGQGSYSECLSSLQNIVFYEGTLNTLLRCSTGPKGTAWSVRPTTNAFSAYTITNFDDTVVPTLTGLFAFNQTGLVIRNTTIVNDTNGPMSTAGVYWVSFDPANVYNNLTGFKVVVIRSGPTCSCVQLSNRNVSVSCTIIYVDHPTFTINAKMSCTANGQNYNATTPPRTPIASNSSQYLYSSTSTVSAKDIGSTTFDCFTTFDAPLVPISHLAKNAPDFSATRQVQCGTITTASTTAIAPSRTTTSLTAGSYSECLSSLQNIVFYEGTLNTLLRCSNGPKGTAWSVRPTSNVATLSDITNFDDTVAPTLTGLFAFNQTGLVIRNTTTVNETNGPISTAGVYVVSFDPANGNRTAFKVVVIRSGPTCSCVQLSTGNVSVSCTIVYADHPIYPINAMMKCTANGQLYSAATPTRTLVPSSPTQYVWNSASTVAAKDTGPTTFDCVTTFAAPLNPISYMAKNAPDFSATRQVQCGAKTTSQAATTRASTTAIAPGRTTTAAPGVHSQCQTPPQNQVVYENDLNRIMTCNSPVPVSWSVLPYNDQATSYKISDYGDYVDPSLSSSYSVSQTDLTIKTATSVASTSTQLTTAGIYTVQNSTFPPKNRTGAKLVVVRGPPSCNCVAINSATNIVTCSITYAEVGLNAIYAMVTWTADGSFIKNDTLNPRTAVDGAYPSTSCITTSAYDLRNYKCTVTFTAPISQDVPYLAKNAPNFSASCIPIC